MPPLVYPSRGVTLERPARHDSFDLGEGFGGWDDWVEVTNFMVAVKKVEVEWNVGGFSHTATLDRTPSLEAGNPNEDPSKFPIIVAQGDNAGGVSETTGTGEDPGSYVSFISFGLGPVYKWTGPPEADGKWYVSGTVNLQRTADEDDPTSLWVVVSSMHDLSVTGAEECGEVNFLGGSVPLWLILGSPGAVSGASITIRGADWWSPL